MAWNKNLPANNGILRLGPSQIRDNWDAIETAATTLQQTGINLASQGSSDLAFLAGAYRLFSKTVSGATELFGISSDETVQQFTGSTPSTGGGGTGTSYSWNFANGLQLRFGNVTPGTPGAQSVTFDSAFSNTGYVAFVIPVMASGTTTSIPLSVNSLTKTGLVYTKVTASSMTVYYLAIGS